MGDHTERLASDQAAWTVALRLHEFGYAGIAANASIPLDRATDLVRRWCAQGKVDALGKQGSNALRFRVVAEGAPALQPPVAPRTPQEAMWFTIRALRNDFTPVDIRALSSTEAVPVSDEDATGFCQMLVRAGYLRVVRKAAPDKKRPAVYRLVRNTGPRPPRQRRISVVWDDNLSEITHLLEGTA